MAGDPVGARRFAREAGALGRARRSSGRRHDLRGRRAARRSPVPRDCSSSDGQPLDKILTAGPIDAIRALRIVRQIASALSDTHAVAVVHRDLQAVEHRVAPRSQRRRSHHVGRLRGSRSASRGNADATRLTGGNLVGTPHYMSPEQAQGDEDRRPLRPLRGRHCILVRARDRRAAVRGRRIRGACSRTSTGLTPRASEKKFVACRRRST